MSRYRISTLAICPFYLHETRPVVFCEGVNDHCVIHVAFDGFGSASSYKTHYCRDNYKECMIYQMLLKKNGGKQNE